jgi:hypothetical protein
MRLRRPCLCVDVGTDEAHSDTFISLSVEIRDAFFKDESLQPQWRMADAAARESVFHGEHAQCHGGTIAFPADDTSGTEDDGGGERGRRRTEGPCVLLPVPCKFNQR